MTNIHATAVIGDGADIGDGVTIGPYCVIGPKVRIGDGAQLHSHVVVDGRTTIGAGCHLFPFASIGTQTQDLKFSGGATFVEIGANTTLREYVTVNAGTNEGEITRVGSGCHLMAYSHVAHACVVGDGVIMANCATLAGHVIVEDQAIIGGLAGVHQFVRVGRMCILGGCTKVTQDCMPFMMIDGNPAQVHGLNSVGLKRKGVKAETQKRLKQAFRIICREDLATQKAMEKIREDVPGCPELDHLLAFIESSKRGIVK
ncbi:MAG: acyl-ACP--UDP-N-acetylglucosamine O-acyltransferase [Verrucomicrobia bacterium]|nr:acyl-ACP--UDP-N-acetylglucosamine O-acyltransferase [Verrucomicrobiota bacterium]